MILSAESRASRLVSSDYTAFSPIAMKGMYEFALQEFKSAEKVAYGAGRMAERARCLAAVRFFEEKIPELLAQCQTEVGRGAIAMIESTLVAIRGAIEEHEQPSAGPPGSKGSASTTGG